MAECQRRLEAQVSPEFLQSQIEVGTRVCGTVKEARQELARMRKCVAEVAGEHGLAPIAASTHPFAAWDRQKHTDKERYNAIARDMQAVARRLVICGMHVHVGLNDDDLRIDLLGQVSYFLPHLLALSTSSPFWRGEETGLKSYRISVFDELPRSGLPESFDSWGEYQRHIDILTRAGVIEDASKLWWDVRPSARFPTLEMRITDICTRLEDTICIAALYLCILRMLWRLRRNNQRWRLYSHILINENRWRAQRYGLDEGLIDFGLGKIVPYAELFDEVLGLIGEDVDFFDCRAEVEHGRTIIARGTSAHKQVATFEAARAAGGAWSGELMPDLARAWEHQRGVVQRVRDSYLDYMKRLGIRAVAGRGRLDGARRVIVERTGERTELNTAHVLLATGSVPALPAGPDIQRAPGRILDTDMLFERPPPAGRRVAILGSGVVATEFAYLLRLFGRDVLWLPRSEPLHRTRFTPQARGALAAALERHAIETRLGTDLRRAAPDGPGVRLTLTDGTQETVDWLLLGTGRRPNTADLGLETAGIETDAGGRIVRDDYLRTTAPGVYAIGDCAGREMTANQALDDAGVVIENLLTGDTRRKDALWVPFVVYSAIELARIGLDDDAAEDLGHEPAVGFAAFETSPCALAEGDGAGFVRLLADLDTGALLGGEIAGAGAGELIHLLSLAPDRETALRLLAAGRYNHPARAEELLNATEIGRAHV